MKYKIISDVDHSEGMEKYEVINAEDLTSLLCTCNLSDFVSKPFTKNTKLKIKSPAIDREENGFICPYDNEIVVVPKKDYWKVTVSYIHSSELITCSSKNKSFTINSKNLASHFSVTIGDKFILKKELTIIEDEYYFAPFDSEFYKA